MVPSVSGWVGGVVFARMYLCLWRPRADEGSSSFTFPRTQGGRVSQSSPELGATASFSSQLSPGIPPLPLRLELHTPSIYMDSGDPNSQFLTCLVSTVTTMSSSQPTLLLLLFIVLIVHICGVEYVMTSEDSIFFSTLFSEIRSQTIAQAGQDLSVILSQLLLSAGMTGARRHTWQHISKTSVTWRVCSSSCLYLPLTLPGFSELCLLCRMAR